jgi:hypothetical protein
VEQFSQFSDVPPVHAQLTTGASACPGVCVTRVLSAVIFASFKSRLAPTRPSPSFTMGGSDIKKTADKLTDAEVRSLPHAAPLFLVDGRRMRFHMARARGLRVRQKKKVKQANKAKANPGKAADKKEKSDAKRERRKESGSVKTFA